MTQRRRFLLLFAVLLIAFEATLLNEWVDARLVRPFTTGIAVVSTAVLRMLAVPVSVHGTNIVGSCFAVNIQNGCNGLEAMLFLAAAVLAFPAAWRQRLAAAAAGALIIQVVNLLRVVTLYLVGCYRREWFETMHLAFWQTVIFATAVLFFVAWTRRVRSDGSSYA